MTCIETGWPSDAGRTMKVSRPIGIGIFVVAIAATIGGVRNYTSEHTPSISLLRHEIAASFAHRLIVEMDDHKIGLTAIVLNASRYTGQVIDLPEPKSLAQVCEDHNAAVGINGGYFDVNFRPV